MDHQASNSGITTEHRADHDDVVPTISTSLLEKFRQRRGLYDEAAEFPSANFEDLHKAGLLKLAVPKVYGGTGLWDKKFRSLYEILEILAKADPSTGQLLQVHTHATGIIARSGTEAQCKKIFSEVVNEGKLIASAGSEVDPKSKTAESGRSELEAVSGGYKLTCFKHFASLGPAADYYLVWTAVPGPTPYPDRQLFVLVPRDGEGVELVDEWDTLGMRSTVSWGIKITGHFVPEERIIGSPGCWVRDPRTFTLAYVANHLGAAEGAFDSAVDFVRERSYLSHSDVIKTTIGDLASRLFATRSSLYVAADQWEEAARQEWNREQLDKAEFMSLQSLHMAKRCSLDVTERVFDICGARATFRSMPFEQIYRDVRTFTLHFRDDLYMARVAEGLLDPATFEAKGKYKRLEFRAAARPKA